MREECVSAKLQLLSLVFGGVHRGDERAAFHSQGGLCGLSVPELAAPVSVATRFGDATARIDVVEAVLGIRRQGPAETLELGDDVVTALVRCILLRYSSM